MQHTESLDSDPPPPPGYQPGYPFLYPKLALNVGSVLLFVMGAFLFTYVGWLLQGKPQEVRYWLTVGEFFLVLVAMIAVLGVHELIHGSVARFLGYRVFYGINWQMPGVYAGMFGQFMLRDHNLLIALAPLLVIDTLLLPLLALPSRPIVLMSLVALVVNTAGAIGDLYSAWRLLRLSHQAQLYDVNPERMLVFEPLERR
jgi:hypothetical protein